MNAWSMRLYGARNMVSYMTGLGLALLSWIAVDLPRLYEHEDKVVEFKAELEAPPPPPPPSVSPPPKPLAPDQAPVTPPPVATPTVPAPVVPQPAVVAPAAPAPVAAPAQPVAAPPQRTAVADAPAPAKPPPPPASKPSAAARFEADLRAYLEQIKHYPTSREARQSRPQGVVHVWMDLDRSGHLVSSGVMESSGSNLLDGEALRTVRGARFPAFPEGEYPGEEQHRFLAALSYSIQ